MSKLITVALLAAFIMSNDAVEYSYEDLVLKYREAQKKKEEKTGEIKVESRQWIHPTQGEVGIEIKKDDEGDAEDLGFQLEGRLYYISNSYIECLQGKPDPNDAYDFPIPTGWLYHTFADKETMRSFFDTEISEHWVLPNVYCNKQGVLTAISWMISPRSMSFNENKGMHKGFRNSPPPFYKGIELENRKAGVYCDWDGWLYASNHGDYEHWFDTNSAEKFTFINVYCDKESNTVRYFYSAVGGAGHFKSDGGVLRKPFGTNMEHLNDLPLNRGKVREPPYYPYISCNWSGWLFWDRTKGTWEGNDKKRRYNYEKYFAVKDKAWVNGRVMNPFCSPDKDNDARYGVVTALRVYCFDGGGNKRCYDLKKSVATE